MSRLSLRNALSALAAVALASAFAISPASASEQEMEYLKQEQWGAAADRRGRHPVGETDQESQSRS